MRACLIAFTIALVVVPTAVPVPAAAQTTEASPPRRSRFAPPWPDDLTPVWINVPREYDAFLKTFRPSADGQSNTTILVDYPGMRPWKLEPGQCKPVCEGQISFSLSTGYDSTLNRAAWGHMRDISFAQQPLAGGGTPKWAITAMSPPPGYTQAWQKVDLKPEPGYPTELAVYLRSAENGTPLEYAECRLRMPTAGPAAGGEPFCSVFTTLDGMPSVQLVISFQARDWAERDAMKAAVMRLVRSWL